MSVSAAVKDDRIYITAPYQFKDVCKQLPGRRWDGEQKCWHTPATPAAAEAIVKAFALHGLTYDEPMRALVTQAAEQRKALTHKQAKELPDIPGKLPAWHHQRQAYWFAHNLEGSMLAMDMGTGKSRTAISLLEGWDATHVLILCPKSVTKVWPNQFEQHAIERWYTVVPPAQATVTKRAVFAFNEMAKARTLGRPFALIVNYESAWREGMAKLIETINWDCIILDESHRAKAPGGKASMFISRIRQRAKRRLCLTGTPMPHSPLDLYAQFRFLDPGIFGTSANRFKNRYAVMGGFENKQIMAWQNEEEMAEKFGSISYVCRKDEVLDLPEQIHEPRVCQLEPRTRRVYKELADDLLAELEEGVVTASNALTRLLRLQQVTSGFVRTEEGVDVRLAADDKLTEKQELLRDALEDLADTEPVIVFCRFQVDLDSVKMLTERLGRRYGELSGRTHSGLTDKATMRDDVDVLAVQIQAGGVGIDLTRSAYAIYYSIGFSLGDYEQSLARLHRPGQTRPVTYLHLIAEETVDEKVYVALAQRKQVVEAVIDASRGGGL